MLYPTANAINVNDNMTKKRKTRKIGLIGVRKSPDDRPKRESSSGKPKRKSGRPAGSRHSAADNKQSTTVKQQHDSRIGSKKPVPLVVESTPKTRPPRQPKYFSPQQELAALEQEQRLQSLLDKLDANRSLTIEEQQYVDKAMARHKQLCEMLGLVEELEDDEPDLDALTMDDYK